MTTALCLLFYRAHLFPGRRPVLIHGNAGVCGAVPFAQRFDNHLTGVQLGHSPLLLLRLTLWYKEYRPK